MTTRQWDDLNTRLATALAMVAVGVVAVWLGGLWFHALIGLVCALMVWELVCLLDDTQTNASVVLAGVAGAVVLIAIELPMALGLPLLIVPAALGLMRLRSAAPLYAAFAVMILLAGYGMMALRDDYGVTWILWLILVVVATDVAGYFAGRALGGPKFWPKVSPKKTWSGTLAGWIAAALVGALFAALTPAGAGLVAFSVAVSLASQLGDICESAMKRHVGAKDSSQLLPGHGGVLDRFDGMLAASVFLVIFGLIVDFPPGGLGAG